jgi:diguanylate cyclase (GGDEF)-like protein
MNDKKNTFKKLSIHDLQHALVHIRSLILDEDRIFDDVGRLKEILTHASISFDDTEDHALVEKLQTQLRHLRTMVYKDELTGILNRHGIREEFASFFDEALFNKGSKEKRVGVTIEDFSVLFIDLDNFKNINDTLGHDAGDEALQKVSSLLKKEMRDIDAVGRFGGEEFVVAMLGATEESAFLKAEDIRKKIEQIPCVHGSHCLTASIGVASLHSSHAESLEQLITFADKAMYEAKTNRGKNNVVKYSELKG